MKINFFNNFCYHESLSKTWERSLVDGIDGLFDNFFGSRAVIFQDKNGIESFYNAESKFFYSPKNKSGFTKSRNIVLFTVGILGIGYLQEKVTGVSKTHFAMAVATTLSTLLLAKACIHARHSFKEFDPCKSLSKGIKITPDMISELEGLIDDITRHNNNDKIDWLSTEPALVANRVFRLKKFPNVVFKISFMSKTKNFESRFAYTVFSKLICKSYKLKGLIIPSATKFTLETGSEEDWFIPKKVTVIAEEYLEFTSGHFDQEQKWKSVKDDTGFDKTLKELVKFVAKTGFHDGAYRNIPIKENKGSDYKFDVMLIDLEHLNCRTAGIVGNKHDFNYFNFGCAETGGLIGIVFSERQVNLIIQQAEEEQMGISKEHILRAKTDRLAELKSDKEIAQFYRERKINKKNQQLVLNESEFQKDFPDELKQCARELVNQLNEQLKQDPHPLGADILFKRHRSLKIGIDNYARKSISREKLERVVNELIRMKLLFKIITNDNSGIWVQG